MRLLIPSVLPFAVVLAFAGCSPPPALAPTPPVEVFVSQPVRGKVDDWDVYTGFVVAPENIKIQSRVRGHIVGVPLKEGQEVKVGDVLFEIDSGPYIAAKMQAEGELKTWQAKLQLAEDKIAIYKPLVEKGSAAKQDLDQAVAGKGEALGGIELSKGKLMEAKLNVGYCTVQAPVAGRVGLAKLTKGNLANATSGSESLLTTLVSVDPMYVEFDVNERAVLGYLKILDDQAKKNPGVKKSPELDASSKNFPVKMSLATDEESTYQGYVVFVDNVLNSQTGSRKLRAQFANPVQADGRRRLAPGMFARVQVTLTDPYDSLMVVDRAILTDQSMKYVLVVDKADKNMVKRVEVVPSLRVQKSGLKAIEAGLKGDEWIIVDGVNRARPGVAVDPKERAMPERPPVKKD